MAQSQKPLADAGTQFLGTAGGAIISAGAIISITGNLNILMLSGSRLPFAMAEQKQLPAFIGSVHRSVLHALRCDSDHRGTDAFPDVEELVCCRANDQHDCTTRNVRRDLSRVADSFAGARMHQQRRFHLPGGTIIALLSLALIVWLLLANSTLQEAQSCGTCRRCRVC